jgi:hypothetical protein
MRIVGPAFYSNDIVRNIRGATTFNQRGSVVIKALCCKPGGRGSYYRILTMVYNFQKYWVFVLYPSSWY